MGDAYVETFAIAQMCSHLALEDCLWDSPPACVPLKKVMYVYKFPTDLVCEFDWLRVVENVRSSNSFSRARAWNSSRTKAADGAETNGLLRHRFQMIVSDHKSLMSSFSAPAGFFPSVSAKSRTRLSVPRAVPFWAPFWVSDVDGGLRHLGSPAVFLEVRSVTAHTAKLLPPVPPRCHHLGTTSLERWFFENGANYTPGELAAKFGC